jgi:hypothetical protein
LFESGSGQADSWQVIIESGSQSPADLLRELDDLDLAASGISVERRVPPVGLSGRGSGNHRRDYRPRSART